MFSVKYIYPDGHECITTDWDYVSAGYVDKNGDTMTRDTPVPDVAGEAWPAYPVVHAHNENQDRRMTFGPNIPPDGNTAPYSLGYVYVMNETGATVAKYTL